MSASKQPGVTGYCRSFKVEVRVIPIHANIAAEQIPGIFMGILSPARYFPPTFEELLDQYSSSGAHRPPSSASRSELLGCLCRSGGERLLSFPSCADGMLLRKSSLKS